MKHTIRAALLALGLVVLCAPFPGAAKEATKPVENTASRKAPSGFAGSVLITTDAEWRKKWGAPGDATPQVAQADVVSRGTKLWALVYFSAPQLDSAGRTNVICDLKFIRPDGKTALDQKGIACFKGLLGGDPRKVYLSSQTIEFVGDPGDPTGTWRIQVILRDMNGKTELPLFTVFTLRE
jgi:hypothetical protein